MPRRLIMVALACLGLLGILVALHNTPNAAEPVFDRSQGALKPVTPLPISQVVLFSSGVGYFQREGEVEGTTRVDLSFPVGDINDLLKSLVLQDLGGGKINAVRYDGADPLEKTLKSFALDLTGNPTFGELLNMARGEKVEVTLQQSATGQPGQMTGFIVGMEEQPAGVGNTIHILNLLCAEGVRNVPLNQVQRVRFLNPVVESELRKALEVLAGAHDMQKKTVSLGFSGEGKRPVRVGYVVDNPIWKTSYRLVVDKNGKLFLQGWAMVENTTDEDWKDVRLALVSGRPISFQTDLYAPLYVPRPIVEPEQFASLRPQLYSGPIVGGQMNLGGNNIGFNQGGNAPVAGMGGLGGLGLAGGLGGGGGINLGVGGGGQTGMQGNGGQNLGVGGGQFGNRYKNFDQVGRPGFPGQNRGDDDDPNVKPNDRLTFQEWQKRQKEKGEAKKDAKNIGSALTRLDPTEGAATQATVEQNGNSYRYVLDEKISLPRQKSALLPILNQNIEGEQVSIYNEAVQHKFPLLGLRFKNSTGNALTQGPITVYEDGSYAGDSRIRDLQPKEEGLLSYAIDQGVEVKTVSKSYPDLTRVKLRPAKDKLFVAFTTRDCKTYLFTNRSDHDRKVLVEHPQRNDWKLETPKPVQRTRDPYRFEVNVPAGKTAWLDVTETKEDSDQAILVLSSGLGQLIDFDLPRFKAQVQVVNQLDSPQYQSARIVAGKLHLTSLRKGTVTYHVKNDSDLARKFEFEHPIVGGWKVVSPAKVGDVKDPFARFDLPVAAGQSARQKVEEELSSGVEVTLDSVSDVTLKEIVESQAANPKVKEALGKIQTYRKAQVERQAEMATLAGKLKEIADDQARIRANLERVPPAADAYKRYLKKFDTQETEIEGLQESIKKAKEAEKKQQHEYAEYVKELSVD
jgi:hypothetical protein